MQNDKDLGFLMSPGEGAVTALAFFTPPGGYAPTHLLSGSADGSLSVWSAGGGWECMKTMRGHRKEVYGIAVHPSGLLGLSVSRWALGGLVVVQGADVGLQVVSEAARGWGAARVHGEGMAWCGCSGFS